MHPIVFVNSRTSVLWTTDGSQDFLKIERKRRGICWLRIFFRETLGRNCTLIRIIVISFEYGVGRCILSEIKGYFFNFSLQSNFIGSLSHNHHNFFIANGKHDVGKCILIHSDRAETAHACAKTLNFEPFKLPATDSNIWQHLIFCSFGLKVLVLSYQKAYLSKHFPYLRLLDDVILRSFCSVMHSKGRGPLSPVTCIF